jgi:hypothetical protein
MINRSQDLYSENYNVNNDFILVFYQCVGEVSNDSLLNFLNQNQIRDQDDVIIFAHRFGGQNHPGISASTLDNVKKGYINLDYRLFSTAEPEGYPCKILYCLNNSFQHSNLDIGQLNALIRRLNITFDWDTLKEKVKEKNIIKPVCIIKHRLMHLLGSLDNDLQGLWDEAERHNREGFCPEKWNEFYQIYKDYDWNRVLNDALELINKELGNVKVDLSPYNKNKIDEFLESIKRAERGLTNGVAHDDNEFVGLLKKVNNFILDIKNNKKNEVYKELKENNGLNPIHKMFKELDKILEKFI